LKRNFLLSALALLLCLGAQAQSAKRVLDKTAQMVKSAGGMLVDYTYLVNNSDHGRGTLRVEGERFSNAMGSVQSLWYDGKTLWTLSDGEVYVSNPSAEELAGIHPYSFLSLYKQNYEVKESKNSCKQFYEIVLKPNKKNTSGLSIVVRIRRSDYQPLSVCLLKDGGNVAVVVQRFLKHQQFPSGTFTFNASAHPGVEVVDMR